MSWPTFKCEKYNHLIPAIGPCESLQGELLRAFSKIVYRFYNDGDYFNEGYGIETAGSAHAFMVSYVSPIADEADAVFKGYLSSIPSSKEKAYEAMLLNLDKELFGWLEENPDLIHTKHDMLKFEPYFEEEEEEDIWA